MIKNLLNGSSLLAIARFDKEADERAALRAKLAGDAKVEAVSDTEKQAKENAGNDDNKSGEEDETGGEEDNEEDEDEKDEDEKDEDDDSNDEKKVEETEAEKAEREKQEKIAAKAKRKQDRMQARIDEATAAKKIAEAEVARLKAQLEADPDKKLTEEEVQARAEALAEKKLQEDNIKKIQDKFDEDCETLRKAAKVVDKEFDAKIADVAETFGPIPSFMIGVLSDLENGGEILAYLAADDDEAERIWDLKTKPAKMAKELALIGIKLEDAKKPKKKEISKVKAIDPVRNNGGRNTQSTVITEADTKDMSKYIQKRIAQREQQRKVRGY